MTYGEIRLVIDSYKRKKKVEAEELTYAQYNLASLIASFTVGLRTGNSIPSISEIYPSLGDCKAQEDRDYKQMMLYKEQFIDFANERNKLMEGQKHDC